MKNQRGERDWVERYGNGSQKGLGMRVWEVHDAVRPTAHAKSLYNYLYFYLGCEEEALDALGETLQRAHLARHKYRGDGSERAWLMKIAVNVAKRQVWRRRHERLLLCGMDGAAVVAAGFNVEEYVLNAYEAQRFLKLLPQPQRQAVWMRVGLEMSDEEVAAVMGVPAGTVSSWVWRSMHRLRLRHAVEN